MCRLQGRFTSEQAEHVRMLMMRCRAGKRMVVDLTDLMYADATGEDVFLLLKRLGAEFIAETAYSRDVCERLDLPQGTAMKTG